ncbi:LysR family transcriptional regulator [Allopusillimonas ginsengisoli]|uniref:LysR family transcriptional regulator n=1 Tax=Allopusillimonas ginsengisoli TaxID=453575 RepID=UPI0010C1FF07|nr:LysR family transcriptional regulator [Allopusillimonas ginsengisoli]
MLTFKQIEALYWVVQLGGFSRAAQKLNTTQSAITKRIRELESDFDVQIFDRSGQKAVLTRKGQEVLDLASQLLSQRDLMLMKIQGFHTFSGVLRLGITEITAMTWLPDMIQQLRLLFPKLVVSPKIGMAAELQHHLLGGQLDMAVLHGELRHPSFESRHLASVPFAWVGSPNLVSPDKIYSPEDISNMSLIRQDAESGLNLIYDEWLSPYKAKSNLFTINSLLAMVGLTVAGFGVSCVPINYFRNLVRAGKLVVVQTSKPLPESTYCAMYAKDANSVFYGEIVEIARAVCNFSVPYGSGVISV